MSVFRLPDTLLDEIQSMLARFWWGSKDHERKIHWRSWEYLCWPKKHGGMGFRNLKIFNDALLAKQGWRLIHYPDSLLARTLGSKYYRGSSFVEARRGYNPSFTWRSIWGSKSLLMEGIGWRVGNGCSISYWTDCWIPDGRTMKCPNLGSFSDLTLRVSDLINQDSRTWNLSLIAQTFDANDAKLISNIPLAVHSAADCLVWPNTRNGHYTVKSGYWLGVNGIASPAVNVIQENFWSCLWDLVVPPKLKVFSWRAMTGSLSVKSGLFARHIVLDDLCERCGNNSETIWHALFQCPRSRHIWEFSPILPSIEATTGDDFAESALSILNTSGEQGLMEFLLLSWVAWTHRNHQVFQHSPGNNNILRVGFKAMINDYRQFHSPSSSIQQNAPISGWMPPSIVLKVNTDAAFIGVDTVGLGAVIRDSYGFVLAAGTRRHDVLWSTDIAEAKALQFGLEIAQ